MCFIGRLMAIAGCYLVKLSFYDDAPRSPVLLRINKDATAGQLYDKVAGEANIKSKFQLFYRDDLIEKCDAPLTQIFRGDEVDVLLVVTADGAGGNPLMSPCVDCPYYSSASSGNMMCGPCNDLTDDIIIGDIVADREDAWSIFCKALDISMNVQLQIKDNSDDPGVRCIDAMHHIYHSNTNLTWNDVQAKVKSYDPSLAKLISECDFIN